jgi:hypothetical protein
MRKGRCEVLESSSLAGSGNLFDGNPFDGNLFDGNLFEVKQISGTEQLSTE